MLVSLIILLVSLILLTVALSELANIAVEGFIGEGKIETIIIGEGTSEMIPSTWGPDIGFFIYAFAIFLLFLTFLLKKRGEVFKRI